MSLSLEELLQRRIEARQAHAQREQLRLSLPAGANLEREAAARLTPPGLGRPLVPGALDALTEDFERMLQAAVDRRERERAREALRLTLPAGARLDEVAARVMPALPAARPRSPDWNARLENVIQAAIDRQQARLARNRAQIAFA